MKILDETTTTLKELRDFEDESAIITCDGVPVMVVLPIEDRGHSAWTLERLAQLAALLEDWIKSVHPDSKARQVESPDVDPGMVEVSIAVAGIAMAIAALLPGLNGISDAVRLTVAIISSVVAALSSYSALWLLAWHCQVEDTHSDDLGIKEIIILLRSTNFGPIWLISLVSLFLFSLSILVGVLAVIR